MRILLADDHALFCQGLQALVQAGGHQVVGAARDGLEALRLARNLHPEVILMDVRMPLCDGLQATRLIQAEMPEVKIVILTTSTDEDDLFEAVRSGASGYLLKSVEPQQLFDALEGVAAGEAPLSPGLSARLLSEFSQMSARAQKAGQAPQDTAVDTLSVRERQVLELVGSGLTYKEAGAQLFISERTVKYHMSQMLRRLHLHNREQVVTWALRSGLLNRS